jgi:autotransporter-associated beta strand protein
VVFAPSVAQTVTISSAIADQTGSGGTGGNAGGWSLVKNGAGTLTLAAVNTYSGGTTLNGGIVAITAGNNLGLAGTGVTFNGGTLRTTGSFSVSRPMTLTGSGALDVASGTLTYSAVMAGGGVLTKTGAGTLILSGANTFTNSTVVSAGTLQVGSGASGQIVGDLVNNSAVVFNRSTAYAYAGAISGTGTLTKSGSGTVTLSGASSYSGGTTVGGGTLMVTSTSSIGTGPVGVGNGILRFDSSASAASLAITVNSGGQARFTGSSTAGNASITNNAVGFSYFLDNASAGSATITNNGTGFTSFEGAATADNATIINLVDGFTDIIGLTAPSIAIGSISGAGNVHLGAKTLTTGGLNTSTTISGEIDGTGGVLVKTGTGTLTLTGASTHTGGTTVTGGTLRVNNSAGSATGSGTVTLGSGSMLAGVGTIGGAVVAQSGSRTAPGNSIGTLTVASYAWEAGATLVVELSNSDATSDRLAVTGALTKSGSGAYQFDFGGTGTLGQTYTLATFASTTFGSGAAFSASNLPAGTSASFALTATSLQVTLVPPATAAPVIALSSGSVAFTENAAALAIDPVMTVTDADSTTLASVTVSITANFTTAEDELATGSLQGNIAASYDAPTGVLSLTSAGTTATLAQWQTTLRSVTYRNTSDAPNIATRSLSFVANDGVNNSPVAVRQVTVAAINDAPTLAGGPLALPGTDEDTVSGGVLVSSMLAGLTYADVDAGALPGIAVVAATGNGVWQYSTDNVAWNTLTPVSASSALLLSGTTRVRYQPDQLNGETAGLTFRAWDQSSGTASTNSTRNLADASSNGGTAAFSAGTAQATLAVTSVNDAPTLTGGPYAFAGASATTPSGAVTVATILAGVARADADSGAQAGLAVTSVTANGHWQYSTDGIAWTNFSTVAASAALLLDQATQVRYVGDGVNAETAMFAFQAWDRTTGTASSNGTRSTADASVNGGTTAFSTGTAQASIAVTTVPVAPAIAGVSASTANGAYRAGQTIAVIVTFDQAVVVDVTGGVPRLQLNSGAAAFATYASGTGTSTLIFNYLIAAGESASDLDCASTAAFALNGGTIRNGSNVAAGLTLAAPGAAGSLGANKDLVVDTGAPGAPVIVAISDDTGVSATDHITSDNTLILSGTAEANSTVTLTRTGIGAIGTATASGAGAWSYDYTGTTLGLGDHVFTATATDAAGNSSGASAPFLVTVDRAANAPVITAISDDTGAASTDGVTSDTKLLFFGTAEPNSIVTLNRSGVGALGVAAVDSAGRWGFDYTGTTLTEGSYLFTATIADQAGNISAASADFPVVVDTTAPAITSAATAGGTYRMAFSYAIVTATSAVSYSATGLPAGVAIDPLTGAITGEPTEVGTFAVTLGATDLAGNATSAPLALTVDRATLTVAGITASNKTVDGSTAATISLGGATLTGVLAGDAVTLGGGVGTFSDATVGANKTVTITGLTLGGAQAANYQLAVTPVTTTASITAPPPPPLQFATVVLSNLNQLYDGTPKAVGVSTSPGGLQVAVTYDGSPVAPTAIGSYAVTAVVMGSYTGSASGTLTISRGSQAISFERAQGLRVGEAYLLRATATSGLPVSFELVSGNATLDGSSLTPKDANPLVVRAAQPGNVSYGPALAVEQTIIDITKLSQTIAFNALDTRVTSDDPFALTAVASSGLVVTFSIVSGPATIESGTTLRLAGAPGLVTVRASQTGNAAYSAAPDVDRAFAVSQRILGRFINLSARARIGTGDGVFITGFVLGGATEKPLLVRAVGPGLGAFGVSGALANPNIRIQRNGVIVAENDNWTSVDGGTAINAASAQVGAFALSPNSADAALLTPLPPGTYTAQISGAGGSTGVALTEVYEASGITSATEQHLLNFSVRAVASSGENMLIVGFVVVGDLPSKILIRGVGPTLSLFGVSGVLENPQLTLRNGAGAVIAQNDDWDSAETATARRAGAFPLPTGSRDAGMVVTVPPGAYTVQLTGAGSGTGVALVEVYEVP